MTGVLLASKYPDRYRESPLFRENEPIRRDDPPRLAVKKLAKAAMATRPGMAALFGAIAVLERAAPRSWLLQRVYKVLTGVYTFAGVREGLARYPLPESSGAAPVASAAAER